MMDRWQPLTVSELVTIMNGYTGHWWLAGGYALELYLGKTIRKHADIDIVIPRNEQQKLKAFLSNWELYVAQGDLIPWENQPFLESPKNDVWAMSDNWFRFQIMFLDVEADQWVFKRSQVKQGPLAEFGIEIVGIPVIKPEIQLLYKFHLTTPREKDQLDWEHTYPKLSNEARTWLDQNLNS